MASMPSPLGHALAGIASGWLIAPTREGMDTGVSIRRAALFGAVAAAPDLDLLAGAHSGPTHGLGAAVIVGAIAWIVLRLRRQDGFGLALAIAAAYASHTLLDWLGTDTAPPIGIMALWPFSHAYYEAPIHVFMAISRRYWLEEFWTSNLQALARELLILGPVVAIVVASGRRRRVSPEDPTHFSGA
jgi:hypothetical protein